MRMLTRSLATLLFFSVVMVPCIAYAVPVPVDTHTLSQADPELDGLMVHFEGEAIGESLRADGDTRWANILDDGVAIGVVAPTEMLQSIDGWGDWSRRGTIVEVTGVFNVACTQHGGDLDVHATEIRMLAPSVPIERPVDFIKLAVAAVVFVLAGALAFVFRMRKRQAL